MELYEIEFKDHLRTKELSDRTLENYLYYLPKLKIFSMLNQDSVNLFLKDNNNNIAKAFIKNYLNFLIRFKKINDLKDIELPKITGRKEIKVPDVLTLNDIELLEKELPSEKHRLMLLISFYCGIRIAGLIALKPYDFNWALFEEDKSRPIQLKVHGKGKKEYLTILPSDLALRIKQYIKVKNAEYNSERDPNKPLFKGAKDGWRKQLERSSLIALKRKVYPHLLRHSCGTYLTKKGMDINQIKSMLGHSSIVSTQRYTHTDLEGLKDSIIKINNSNIPDINSNHVGDSSTIISKPSIQIAPDKSKQEEQEPTNQNEHDIKSKKQPQSTQNLIISTTESPPSKIDITNDAVDNKINDLKDDISSKNDIDNTNNENAQRDGIKDDSEFDVLIESHEQEQYY